MAIHYYSHYHQYGMVHDQFQPERRIVLLDPALEKGRESMLDRYRNLPFGMRGIDGLVLRGRGEVFLDRIRQDRAFGTMIIAEDIPTTALVGGMADGQILYEASLHGRPLCPPPEIAECRIAELLSIIRRNDAIWGPHENLHYQLPAGEHAEAFVRIGTALRCPVEVDRIADWILPYVSQKTGILLDSGTLLPLALAIKLAAAELYGHQVFLGAITSYPINPETVEDALHDLQWEIGADGKLLSLISVSATGRTLAQRLKLAVGEGHNALVICDTNEHSNPDALLNIPISRSSPGPDGKCSECNKQLLSIDLSTYEVPRELEYSFVKIKRTAAEKHREFWEAVDAESAVKMHYDLFVDSPAGPKRRHNSIYIDIVALLHSPWFRSLCKSKLAGMERPALVLIPKHRGADAVRALTTCVFAGVPTVEFSGDAKFSQEVQSAVLRVCADEIIMIADDGMVSGQTLRGARTEIQTIFAKKAQMPKVSAFVILARASSKRDILKMKNTFYHGQKSQLEIGYEIYLPGLGYCPWCEERQFLSRKLPTLSQLTQPYAAARLKHLEGDLSAPILLGGKIESIDAKSHGSFFGVLGHEAAFAAAAACMYEAWLDATNDLDESTVSKRRYLIDLPDLISKFFADQFLPAILRMIDARHLHHSGQTRPILDQLDSSSANQAFESHVPEMLWAVINRKLPADAATVLLKQLDSQDEAIELLRELLRG